MVSGHAGLFFPSLVPIAAVRALPITTIEPTTRGVSWEPPFTTMHTFESQGLAGCHGNRHSHTTEFRVGTSPWTSEWGGNLHRTVPFICGVLESEMDCCHSSSNNVFDLARSVVRLSHGSRLIGSRSLPLIAMPNSCLAPRQVVR